MKTLEYYRTEGTIECGIDECGRGAYAGPVVAAAVIWPAEPVSYYDKYIRDSKKLSFKKRKEVAEYIRSNAIDYSVQFIDNNEIDKVNILQATFNAMHKCLDALSFPFEHILVDGDKFRIYQNIPHNCVIKGDDKYINIAAASIIAKVARDEYMIQLSKKTAYENYGWDTNMGYGTAEHRNAISVHGLTDMHRTSFNI
jgi:ribonuclease HII